MEVSNFNILFRIQHRWHIKCLNWENVSFYGKNKLILNFMASTHLKKVGTRPCLPLCGIPSSFITVCKRLGTEETSCSSLGIGMLSHSCLIQASSCSTVLGLLCRIFLFMMRQMFSMGERSGLQAGHFSTRILLLRSHDVVIDAVCGLALSCWKMQGLPWKRRRLDGSICCSRTWIYLSALMVPFQMCKLPMPHALMQPHTIRDAGFWTERW